MFVKTRMSSKPITVESESTVVEASKLMRKHNFRRLPVLEEGVLVGIVTDRDLLKVSPSVATTLSIYEMNYVLSKIKVSDVMTKEPVTVDANALIEEAAMLMKENDISGLPVLDDGELVGLITESDVFDAFVDLMGLQNGGTRLALSLDDHTGVLADITRLINEKGLNIISLATFHTPPGDGANVVLRLGTDDIGDLEQELNRLGYKVLHTSKM